MKRASAPSYDLFKTIVTIVLAAILLLMLLRGCATNPVSPAPTENVVVSTSTHALTLSPATTETLPAATVTETLVPSPSPTAVEPTTTSTAVDASPTSAPTESPTTVPGQVTPTQVPSESCNTRVPSRLQVGQKARVVRRLNMRSDASIHAAIMQTNSTSTQVEIIGGPVCTPLGNSAYRWWQIRLPNGTEGWSAESPLNEASYFLEPVP